MTAPTGTRVSLVIGGVKGIGAATSRKLAGEGPVFATYLRDEAAAAAFQAQAERDGLPIRTLQADVRTRAAVEALVKSVVEEAGGIDVAVFAAVSAQLKSPLSLSEEGWWDVLNTNTSPFLWLGQQMANVGRERGRLIALTSPWSHRYVEGYGAIGPSKAALESLVVYLASELASRGTTVNAVSGGLVNTALLRSLVPAKEIAAVVQRTPLGRIGEPEDIASAVSWLASEASGWMTGQVVTLDGGYFLR